jgi:endonuclease YncB( thermonuclease family)
MSAGHRTETDRGRPGHTPVADGSARTPGIVIVRVLVVILCLGFLSNAACEAPAHDTGRVVRVLDGDSLIVRQADGEDIEVRLFGIDAPEYRQPWSRKSRQALSRLAGDRLVRLEVRAVDRYGRSVAVLRRVSDELDVGREMVRLGQAWVYRRYTDDGTLITLEVEARAAGLGLWSMPESQRIPPWEWRRQNRPARQHEGSR